MKQYVVTASIHGPEGAFDVSEEKTGKTLCVAFRRKDAKLIADLLNENEFAVPLAKLGGR